MNEESVVDDQAVTRVELVARELWRQRALGTLHPHYKWENLAPEGRERLRDNARSVMAVLEAA